MKISAKYCRYCGRLLKSKESIERGYGLICYQKHLLNSNRGLFANFSNKEKSKLKEASIVDNKE